MDQNTPAGTPANPAPVQAPTPPPAAETVVNGNETEEVIAMRKKLQETEDAKKKTELRNMQLEDENRQLKSIPKDPQPAAPKKSVGWGFYRREEEA